MKAFLMQHGVYIPEKQDPEKSLSPEGKKSIQKAGRLLKKLDVAAEVVLVSSKKRSKDTGLIIAKELSIANTVENKAIEPKSSPEEILKFIQSLSVESFFIAGHLPSLQLFASYLLSKDQAILDFEMGGCAFIETENLDSHQGHLKWFLPPTIYN